MTSSKPVRPGGAALHALLTHAIDYAGLFPPAQLDLAGAVSEYASYLDSDDVWALGRFVIPASRLAEFADVAAQERTAESLGAGAWSLSAVMGSDLEADMGLVQTFNAAHGVESDHPLGNVDAIELRAPTPPAIAKAMNIVPATLERFVEVPIAGDVTPLVRAIGAASAYAKVRTGGTTADAFPPSADLARFLAACVAERVPFKATAGLHHPLRGDYPLTYEPGSVAGRMYGFLNVILAPALLAAGASESEAQRLLEEPNASAVQIDGAGVRWNGHRLTSAQLLDSRQIAMRSFGSCSFREPIDDLGSLGLL